VSGAQIERRRFGRRDVCKCAEILLPDGERIRCIVVNISEGGALLNRLDDRNLPDFFELVIPTDDVVTSCRVAHRTNGKIGVEYVSLPRRASRVLTDPNRDERMAALRARLSGK
jgi:hypothetical protein